MSVPLSFGNRVLGDRRVLVPLFLVGIATGWVLQLPRELPTRLAFIRCAQGNSTLFQHAGVNVLIDCGPRNDRVDAGERLVSPELYRLGVRRLDFVVITHPDSDHVGGLVSIARRFSIGKVLISDLFRHHSDMQRWLAQARIPLEKVTWVSPQSTLTWGGWTCRVQRPRFWQPATDNDGSLAVRIQGPNQSVTITGDASFDAEEAMVEDGAIEPSELLLAGHHGSRTSTGDTLLRAVKPDHVIVSAGRNNPYGHPNPDVLERIASVGATVWRTDRGTIEFTPAAQGWLRPIR